MSLAWSFAPVMGIPASFAAFRAEGARSGFREYLRGPMMHSKRLHPPSNLKKFCQGWADELISENHVAEAISLLRLNRLKLSKLERCVPLIWCGYVKLVNEKSYRLL